MLGQFQNAFRTAEDNNRKIEQIIDEKVVKKSMVIKTLIGESLDGMTAELEDIPVEDTNGDGKISIKEKVSAIIKNSDLFLTIILSMLADPILVILTAGIEGFWDFSPLMSALKLLVVPFIITFIFKSNDKKNTKLEKVMDDKVKEVENNNKSLKSIIEKLRDENKALKVSVLLKDSEIKLYQNNVLTAENYAKMAEAIKPDIETIKKEIE